MLATEEDPPSEPQSDFASGAESKTGRGDGGGVPTALRRLQTGYDESGASSDSDLNWEEVDLKDSVKAEHATSASEDESRPLNIVLHDNGITGQKQRGPKRRLVTAAERKLRLEIHKMHLLSLLAHIYLRNHWCNNQDVQVRLIQHFRSISSN